MSADSRRILVICCAVGAALLVAAHARVVVLHTGSRAGQTYRGVCRDSGAELSYTPSVFGGVRLTPGRAGAERGRRWELVEPRPPSPVLPWNWLALLLQPPAPDPEVVIRQATLGAE